MNGLHDSLKDINKRPGFAGDIFDTRNLYQSLITLLFLLLIGWLGFNVTHREIKKNLGAQLQASLEANIGALKTWIEEERNKVRVWAEEQTTRQAIVSLEKKVSQGTLSADELLTAPEAALLRQHLGLVTENYGLVGFVVFDRTGLQISALLNDPVGKRELIHRADFIERSLKGETVMSLPFIAETPLPTPYGKWKQHWPTMFFSAPVRDNNGAIVAVLAFRHRPEAHFTRLMEVSRTGATGETYAFDANALMITDSRFNEQLRQDGIIRNHPDSHAILSVKLQVPHQNTIPKSRASKPETPALTRMAASALKGESGMDLDGYKDYRGASVVGAWAWLAEYGFGMATEIDVVEAYAPLISLNHMFMVLFGLLMVSVILNLVFRSRQNLLSKKHQRTEKAFRQSIAYLDGLVSHFTDGIITIDGDGTIQSFNPAAEKLFGYSSPAMIGEQITLLMPEPYKSRHREKFQARTQRGSKGVASQMVEVEGLKKDGNRFPMEISISEIVMDNRRLFVGIARDITERRSAERELRKNRIELELKVVRRTAELMKANRQLQQEINGSEKTQKRLAASLKEKEILLKEVHHRTKNNLQIISSLYGLALSHAGEDQYEDVYRDNHNRIRSMALVHDIILRSENLTQIDSGEYLGSLASALLNSFGFRGNRIALKVQTDGTPIDLNVGIYCGLIINELVTNALKYAFSDNNGGEIILGFRKNQDTNLEMTVKDNGRELPVDFDLRKNSSLGLQLVTALVEEQLGGAVTLRREQGTEFHIEFPMGANYGQPKIQSSDC